MDKNRKKKTPGFSADSASPGRNRTGPGTRPKEFGKPRIPSGPREKAENLVVGRNAVAELIRSGAPVDKIYAAEVEGSAVAILAEARESGITVIDTTNEALSRMAGGEKHQGIAAVAAEKAYSTVEDILKIAEDRGEKPLIVVCDGIEDPHNLGAVIRCAECAGAHGVIIPKNRAVGLTATVAKASAGALNYTPVARVTNLKNTVEDLKKRGVWFACADMDGKTVFEQDLKGPVGIVIGSEGDGVSRLLKEKCDFIVSIPTRGDIDSLNASVAAGVLAFEVVRQRYC